MPLQKQAIDLPLTAGLEQGTREESRELAAGMTTLENTLQVKRGAWSKRPGHAIIGANGSVGSTTALLATHRDEALIQYSGDAVYAYSPAGDRWNSRGTAPSLTTERYGLASPGIYRGCVVYDVVQCNGYLVMILEGPQALFATVLDADTKAPILGPTKLSSGLTTGDATQQFRASLVVCGTYVICVYNRENLTALTREDAIWGRVLDTADINSGWAAAFNMFAAGVIDLTVGNFLFDVSPCSSTSFLLLYENVILTQTLVKISCPALGVLLSQACFVGIPGVPPAFSVDCHDGQTAWLAHCQFAAGGATAVEARETVALGISGALLLAAFPSQIIGGETGQSVSCAMVRTGTSTAKIVVSGANTLAASYTRTWMGWRNVELSAGNVVTSGAASLVANVEHTHKPWRTTGGFCYVVIVPKDDFDTLPASPPIEVAFATNLQRCMYVVDITTARTDAAAQPCANLAPRINATNGTLYYPRYTRSVATFSDGRRGIIYPTLRSGSSESFELAELSPTTAGSAASLGGVTHMAGGVAWQYDGNKPIETAFVQAPRVKAFTAGGGTLNGTYLYTAVWEHEDAAGNAHYSEPAAPITVTHAGATSSTIRITAPTVTYRPENTNGADRIRAVLYRTAAGGSTYYRCAEANAMGLGSNSFTFQTIVDNMADATLTQRARLYTQPGTLGTSLPRRAPPGLRYVVQHGDMLAGIADDLRTVWFSAPIVSGEGQWFTDAFIVEVDDVSPLVALASFDGRLFALTRAGVWAIDGQGWTENGSGGMSLPQRIPVDVGCIDARSVVVTPMGALFQSDQGICLLSRSGQVTFFGEAVSTTLAAYPTITSAVLNAVESMVIFTCRSGSSGVQLVYDYTTNAWSTERIGASIAADSACMVAGVYHRATEGTIRRRTAGAYLELPTASGWMGQTIETGWAKLSGLQGYQRIWRVLIAYTRRSAFSLRVSFAFDYSATYTETRTYTEAEITAMAEPLLEIAPTRQKCRAIRVKLEELTPATVGTGQGFELVGLRFVVGLKERAGYPAAAKK